MLLALFAALTLSADAFGQSGAPPHPLLPGIEGADDRILLESTDYPWRTLGRVNRAVGGHCTGALIAPRIVITAAHCLWNKRTRNWLPPGSLHFLAGYRRGTYLAHARVRSFRLAEGRRRAGDPRSRSPQDDWALLTLDAPLGETIGHLVLAPGSENIAVGSVTQAGYSQDKAHILTRVPQCNLIGRTAAGALLLHDCDATKGDSGSPILLQRDDRYWLLAIHVATAKRGGRAIGLAVPVEAFRHALGAPP